MKNIEIVKERIANIVATNKNDIYNSHLYWSQKPYNICDILIEELTEEGDVIFDPFMGSGVTIIESLKSNYKRKAIEALQASNYQLFHHILNNFFRFF